MKKDFLFDILVREVDKMLFHGENPVLRIVDVSHLSWQGGTFQVAPRDFSVLTFRIGGSATIQSSSGERCVNTNDILYLPQNMAYTATYTDTEVIAIHFVTLQDDKNVETYTFQNGEEIYKQFMKALNLWQGKTPGFAVSAMGQLYSILGTIFEWETKSNLPPHFLKAVSLINSGYRSNSISVGDICARAGISATVFRQLFQKHYQKNPTEYLTELRLEYARNLIAGGMSVENAAYESGFNDPKYFARVVKKRFGCTPRALKRYGK